MPDNIVREIKVKTILSPSRIYEWTINPYVGCQHACLYCYARFIKRFSGHKEPWGKFVDVKLNGADLLGAELAKKKRGRIWISGVCDPYQPLEAEYKLTRRCLEVLAPKNWPVVVQTRSPLVLRDLELLKEIKDLTVGLSITTADDAVRRKFEPAAPPINDRLKALSKLRNAGLRTYAMVAPVLPGAEGLAEQLEGKVDYLLLDRMNYHYADWVYRKYGWEDKQGEIYFQQIKQKLARKFLLHCHI